MQPVFLRYARRVNHVAQIVFRVGDNESRVCKVGGSTGGHGLRGGISLHYGSTTIVPFMPRWLRSTYRKCNQDRGSFRSRKAQRAGKTDIAAKADHVEIDVHLKTKDTGGPQFAVEKR